MSAYIIDIPFIAQEATNREAENNSFLRSLKDLSPVELDNTVIAINEAVSAGIDCTQCANCCKTLIIDVNAAEITALAAHLEMPEAALKEKYIEESSQGRCFINTIPCHFLQENKCTVYTKRFADCKDFPHLHKTGFKERAPGIMMYYGSCPIIYHVIEQVKVVFG